MSEVTRDRIAVLQHARRQQTSLEKLSRISEQLGERHHQPVDASLSLRLQVNLYAKLEAMRARGSLRSTVLADPTSATENIHAHIAALGPQAIFEVYAGATGSGFFSGPLSQQFLRACLEQGHDGIAVVLPGLGSGAVLDVALDDPLRGNFYEVEWWQEAD